MWRRHAFLAETRKPCVVTIAGTCDRGGMDVADVVQVHQPRTSDAVQQQGGASKSGQDLNCMLHRLNIQRDAPSCTRGPEDHALWVIGGLDRDMNVLKSVEVLSADNSYGGSWNIFYRALQRGRVFHGSTATPDGQHFVVGGADGLYVGANVYADIEIADLRLHSSQQSHFEFFGTRLDAARAGHVVAYAPRARALVAVGGYGGGSTYHRSGEILNLDQGANSFTMLPSMKYARTGAGGGFGPDGSMYMVGGSPDGGAGLACGEKLDLRMPRWEALPPMTVARGYVTGVWGCDGRLYICGGSIISNGMLVTYDTVEAYDPRMNTWEMQPAPLHRACADLTGASILR